MKIVIDGALVDGDKSTVQRRKGLASTGKALFNRSFSSNSNDDESNDEQQAEKEDRANTARRRFSVDQQVEARLLHQRGIISEVELDKLLATIQAADSDLEKNHYPEIGEARELDDSSAHTQTRGEIISQEGRAQPTKIHNFTGSQAMEENDSEEKEDEGAADDGWWSWPWAWEGGGGASGTHISRSYISSDSQSQSDGWSRYESAGSFSLYEDALDAPYDDADLEGAFTFRETDPVIRAKAKAAYVVGFEDEESDGDDEGAGARAGTGEQEQEQWWVRDDALEFARREERARWGGTRPTARFVAAEKGDMQKAQARWQATIDWRRSRNTCSLLLEPHPTFPAIKQYYPHFFHGRSKEGHQVYFEQVGGIDLAALSAQGVTMAALLRHYTFSCEFLWRVLEEDRLVTVMDVAGIGMGDFRGEVVEYVKAAMAISSTHYPERSACIFIINVPLWFSMVWKMISPLVDPVTRQKIHIVRGKADSQRTLLQHIALDQLPSDYGGTGGAMGESEQVAVVTPARRYLEMRSWSWGS